MCLDGSPRNVFKLEVINSHLMPRRFHLNSNRKRTTNSVNEYAMWTMESSQCGDDARGAINIQSDGVIEYVFQHQIKSEWTNNKHELQITSRDRPLQNKLIIVEKQSEIVSGTVNQYS